jgi:hypothetical protein
VVPTYGKQIIKEKHGQQYNYNTSTLMCNYHLFIVHLRTLPLAETVQHLMV